MGCARRELSSSYYIRETTIITYSDNSRGTPQESGSTYWHAMNSEFQRQS